MKHVNKKNVGMMNLINNVNQHIHL